METNQKPGMSLIKQSNTHTRMHCGTKELRACCRPTETGAGPSDARALVCSLPAPGALNSRVLLRIPIGSVDVGTARCAHHRHALRTPQARAQCLLACLASSCSAISATAVQPSSAARCGIGRRETLQASTQIAYTRAHCLLDCCHSVLRRHALPSAPLPCNPAVPPTAG